MSTQLPVIGDSSPDFQIQPFKDISRTDGLLNVADILDCTSTHGPGRRLSLWTQECFRRCLGCTNGHMLTSKDAHLMSMSTVLKRVKTAYEGAADIEGITLQGGEPVLQAKNIALLLKRVHEEISRDINVLLFTGYTIDQLYALQSESVDALLEQVDTVIDGAFYKDLLDAASIRGSTNQSFHHLKPTLEKRDFSRHGADRVFTLGESMIRETGIEIIA